MKTSKHFKSGIFFFQLNVLNRKSRLALINFAFFPFVIKLKNKIVHPFLSRISFFFNLFSRAKWKWKQEECNLFKEKKTLYGFFETRLPGYFLTYANQKLYHIIWDELISRMALKTKDTCLEISRLLAK